MRALVVLAVLGVCSAFPFIPDDPEVAAEKARFFRTFKIIEGASKPKLGGVALRPALPSQAYVAPRPQPKWVGPLASEIPASLPGSSPVVVETPEVASARRNFFNTYKHQVAVTLPKPGAPTYYSPRAPTYRPEPRPQPKWTGPLASSIPASLPGSSPVVIDTPEVSNAKAAFYNTYHRQVKTVLPSPY